MLGQAKPLASLSATLLARKGQARPAMRPQSFTSLAPPITPVEPVDDLGWNDMGLDEDEDSIVDAPAVAPTPIAADVAPDADAPPPPVLAAREALRETFETPELVKAVKTVSLATAGRLQRETMHLRRAAFTLRLDADRHLKLRLASAITHRSAQQLVSHALDQFLITLPEVNTLIGQLPAAPGLTRNR